MHNVLKIVLAAYVLLLFSSYAHSSQCDEEIVGFRKLGIHYATDVDGTKYMKIFYLSIDFEANWMDSRSFCKAYDMDLATFESSYEFSNFLKHAMRNVNYFDKWTHIGGISKFIGKHRDWFWITTNRRVTFNMQFAVGQPNNYLGRQNCLGISKEEKTFEFQDIDCHGRFEEKFICQKICLSN